MDISKGKIKVYGGLGLRKHRLAQGLFVAEGEKCVGETLPFFELEALVATPAWLEVRGVPKGVDPERVMTATPLQMEQLSNLSTAPQVLAVYRLPQVKVPEPEELRGELALMLDGVQDPGNLGTIMRCADWFGVRHIIASPDTVDIFNPKAVQATMGAIGRVYISYTDLVPYLSEYKSVTGNPVYGTLLEGSNLYEASLKNNGLVIMGNEGKGISGAVRAEITAGLRIPSWPEGVPTVESLNVAMATAITVAEFRRQLMTNYK